ncbi:MAG: hypothetical protein GF411_14560 [Candidatus Lokiarchaeota archaeon]|nr:hypothetical protein [Candidatus Lokiarchaeota archaeon]
MKSDKEKNQDDRKSLYTYWHELGFFSEKEAKNIEQVRQSEIKWFIIKYIRDGVEDEFGRKHNLSRRHAFSAKELHEAYLKSPNHEECSLSNFHFHIKSLVEDGYLKEVARILEGRHYVTYYGRTSIIFFDQFEGPLQTSISQDFFDPLKILIKTMNSDLEVDYINQLVEDHLKAIVDFFSRFFSWIKENYPQIYNSKIDLHTFTQIASHYSIFHPGLQKTSKEIGSLIGLDKIMDYERYF